MYQSNRRIKKSLLQQFLETLRERFLRGSAEIFRVTRGTWRQMRDADVQILASSLAFATVLSLVPLMAVSLSVFKAFGGFEQLFHRIEPFILRNFVEASGAEVSRVIQRSVQRIHSGTLGLTGALSLLLIATKLFNDMERAIQRIYHVKKKRWLLKRLAVYWAVIFLGPLILAVTLGLLTSRNLGLIRVLPKESLSFAIAFIGLLLIYKYVPVVIVRWRAALISAMVAAVGIMVAQEFYATLMKSMLRYSKIYGSLASVPIFLIWILVLWWIVLAGVALCATLNRATLDGEAREN